MACLIINPNPPVPSPTPIGLRKCQNNGGEKLEKVSVFYLMPDYCDLYAYVLMYVDKHKL